MKSTQELGWGYYCIHEYSRYILRLGGEGLGCHIVIVVSADATAA